MPPKKRNNSVVEREGVNYVRRVVEAENCIFHDIPEENDFGNDGFIELVDGESVRGITLAVQIKSGKSFISGDFCKIPASRDKYEYWMDHSLSVIGIVYDPKEQAAYWINISYYLKLNRHVLDKGPFTVTFPKKEIGRFTPDGFRKFFLPLFLNKPIQLSFDRAVRFATDEDFDLHSCGIHCLMHQHSHRPGTWALFLKLLRERSPEQIDPHLIYFLAHIPGHPDIFLRENTRIPGPLKARLKRKITSFTPVDVLKLIEFIDESGDFERGSVGQSVEAIIALVDDKKRILLEIARDSTVATTTRENSAILFSYYAQLGGIRALEEILKEDPSIGWVSELLQQLQTEGYVYLY